MQVWRFGEDQAALGDRGVVERRVREGDVGDRVVAQPGAVGAVGELAFVVEDVVPGGVELAQPAAGEVEVGRQVGGLPVVLGRGHLDPLRPRPRAAAASAAAGRK